MDIMSEVEIWKQFLRRYNQNPLGWRMYAGVSNAGYSELLINHPKHSWLIKRDSLYSGMPGIGGIIEDSVKPELRVEQTGIRPIPKHAIKKVVAMVEGGIDIMEATKIIDSILAQEPTNFDELKRIRPPGVMQGPIVHFYRPIQSIVGGQLELDAKLEAELERLKERRTSYIG